MVIDAHAHLVAPSALYAHRSNPVVSGGRMAAAIVLKCPIDCWKKA